MMEEMPIGLDVRPFEEGPGCLMSNLIVERGSAWSEVPPEAVLGGGGPSPAG